MSISANTKNLSANVSIRSVLDNITETAILLSLSGHITDFNRQFQMKVPEAKSSLNINEIFEVSSTSYGVKYITEMAELALTRTGLFPIQLSFKNDSSNAERGIPCYLSALRFAESKEPAAILIQLDEHLLRLFSRFISLREEQYNHARQAMLASVEATTDELTGLKNRRFLNSILDFQWNATKRSSEDAVLIIFDIDHFKRINDHYGHNVGDKAIKAFAKCLEAEARAADIVARWGGEEFVLILSNCDESDAELFLKRAMDEIRNLVVSADDAVIRMTASAGFVSLSKTTSVENALSRADKALYQAKKTGRNQFIKCPQANL